MTYLPPPKGTFDVEWATQNNRIIQQEIGKLGPLASRVSELETGKQPSDADLTAIAALTGTGMLERAGDDTWALRSTGAVGRSLLALAAPGAVRHIRVNADGSVDLRAAADYRGDLGLGTAAVENIGTSGANVPLLNGNNTWSGTNGFQAVTAATLTTTGHIRSTGAVSSNVASNITLDFSGGFGRVSAYGPDNSTVGTLRLRAITANASAAGGIIDLSSTGAAVTGNTSITGTLTTTGNTTLGDASTDNTVIRGSCLVARPSDHWSSSVSFYAVGSEATPLGQLDHHGSFRVSLTSNGYRNNSGTWTSYGANGQSGAAAIELSPDGVIYFNTNATKANGSGNAITNRGSWNDSGLSITGSISASNLAGTTYTPTGTGVTNVTSVTPSLAIYIRFSGAVSVSGKVSIVTTAVGPTTARLSLPVASNIGTTTDVSGVAIATDGTVATISGDATNDAALISFTASAGTLFQFEAAFKYRIL